MIKLAAEIKRPEGTGIEDVLMTMTPQQVEEALRIETSTGSTEYNRLLGILEAYLDHQEWGAAPRSILHCLDDVLTPEHINKFLQMTTALENHPEYSARTGGFISKLIQNSYNAGNNDFTLRLKNLKEMKFIGHQLKGTEEKPITITITGKVGKYCGKEAEHTIFNLDETEDYCGEGAKHSVFNAKKMGEWCGGYVEDAIFKTEQAGDHYGDSAKKSKFKAKKTGDHAGLGAKESTFNLEETGKYCGEAAEESIFTLGEVGYDCALNAQWCTFKTKDRHTLREILHRAQRGNTVILIHPDGTEEVR